MYAVTKIRHREPGSDNNLVFNPGDEVKGLPKEVVQRLVQLGSVVKDNPFPVEEEEAPVVEEVKKPAPKSE